jgi:hypothetical protein
MDQDRRDFLQDSARLGAFALTSTDAAYWHEADLTGPVNDVSSWG